MYVFVKQVQPLDAQKIHQPPGILRRIFLQEMMSSQDILWLQLMKKRCEAAQTIRIQSLPAARQNVMMAPANRDLRWIPRR